MRMGEGQMELLDAGLLTLGQGVMYNNILVIPLAGVGYRGEWYMRSKTRKNPTSARLDLFSWKADKSSNTV
jgi:hypothetical protein